MMDIFQIIAAMALIYFMYDYGKILGEKEEYERYKTFREKYEKDHL